MAVLPIRALADTLFGNSQDDQRVEGLKIFTDRSLSENATNARLNVGIGVQLRGVVPQQINFVQRSRISEQVIKDGKAFFFWKKDRQSRHLDLLEIRINGVTRSLQYQPRRPRNAFEVLGRSLNELKNTVRVGPAGTTPPGERLTRKQAEWLRLWELTREPFVDEQGINLHHIVLKTPALPFEIDFAGHFQNPIEWTERADNPFLVDWSLSLIVHQTQPSLDVVFAASKLFTFDQQRETETTFAPEVQAAIDEELEELG